MTQTNVMEKVYGFIDAIQTVAPRGSFYSSKEQKVAALKKSHDEIKSIDKDLYKLFMFYPGINDYNCLNIAGNILSDQNMSNMNLPVTVDNVPDVWMHKSFPKVFRNISYPRVLKFMLELKGRKINNKRLKRTALSFILSDEKIISRSLKYRRKMQGVLEHVWGKQHSSVLCSFLKKFVEGTANDIRIKNTLQREVWKYNIHGKLSERGIAEAVLFIFRTPEVNYLSPDYKAYEKAKINIEDGFDLPYETLLGIRNNHHKDFDLKPVLEKTKDKMTKTQKITLQRTAEKKDVKIKVEFSNYNPVQLYKYAYERGWTDEIKTALDKRVGKTLEKFNLNLGKIVLVIDNSQSMIGKKDQKYDPMARILSIAKFLEKSSTACSRFYTTPTENEDLPIVEGDSSIGKTLIKAVKQNEALIQYTTFILSDGYENAPEGLTTLVIKGLRNTGFNKSIVHINPTYAVESRKAKQLSPEISTMPLFDLEKLEGIFMKALLQKNPTEGVKFLKTYLFGFANKYFNVALPESVKSELEEQRKIDFKVLI